MPSPTPVTAHATTPGPTAQVVDLAVPLFVGMPQSPNHPQFRHTLVRRHGDMVRADGGSAANDLIVMGTHVGTHIDALAHVSHNGTLHGGADALAAQVGGGFETHGVHTVPPLYAAGVLLDIPAVLGLEACEPGYEVTVADLETAVKAHEVTIKPGSVVLIRTGWGRRFANGDAFVGRDSGVPGVGEDGACWLAEHQVAAVGADSIAFERLAPGAGHTALPAHRVLLVEHGVLIFETLALEELAATGAREFTFVAAPLPIMGATGSPVRPLAILPNWEETR